MEWDHVKRNWTSVSGDIKCKWGKFSEEDLLLIAGQREPFIRLFALRYEREQPDAVATVDRFVGSLDSRPISWFPIRWLGRFWTALCRRIRSPIGPRIAIDPITVIPSPQSLAVDSPLPSNPHFAVHRGIAAKNRRRSVAPSRSQ